MGRLNTQQKRLVKSIKAKGWALIGDSNNRESEDLEIRGKRHEPIAIFNGGNAWSELFSFIEGYETALKEAGAILINMGHDFSLRGHV